MLVKPNSSGKSAAASLSVADYIQQRVQSAVDGNYASTKMWIKKDNLTEAHQLLQQAGFQSIQLQEEPKSVQLEVTW